MYSGCFERTRLHRFCYLFQLTLISPSQLFLHIIPTVSTIMSKSTSSEHGDPNHNEKYVFFYGWEPIPTYPISLACYSQWYDAPFTDHNYPKLGFKTCEHYMMYRKALLFDPEVADEIVNAPTPDEAKKRGRKVRNFDREILNQHADGIVERANYPSSISMRH